ncbi:MAG: hypothetical protein KME29_05385 [Calothrix sp. FI2-JRJ7]|jgi:hypothetical protein|nr:hypothetical protein [Calothrix sp. FI2-JRJ7]
MNSDEPELKRELSSAREDSSFYTRHEDGVSGMSVTALSVLCGTEQHVITELLNRVRDSNAIVNNLPVSLKPFAGKEHRLIVNTKDSSLFIIDDICHAVLEYYALDARKYKGKQIAQKNYRMVAKAGLRIFIWSKTGYTPYGTSALTQQQVDLIESIPKLQQTIAQIQSQVQNLLPSTSNSTIPPDWNPQAWKNLPPQDKRHFRYLYRRRRFRPSDQGVSEQVVEKVVTSSQLKIRANQEIQAAIGEVSELEKQQLKAAKQQILKQFWDSDT